MRRRARSAEAKSTPQFPLECALPQALISSEGLCVTAEVASARKKIGVTGFEPATSWSQTRRSTKLSYTPPMGVTYHAPAHGACGILASHWNDLLALAISYLISMFRTQLTIGDDRRMNQMKFLVAIIAMALSLPATLASAQEPPLPVKTEAPAPTPGASPASTRPQLNIPEIPLAVEPPNLVPDSSPTISRHPTIPALTKTAPALSELDAAFQKSPLAQEAEEQRLHLEWRQLQNRVAHDPEVVAAKAATTTARTDLEKRVRLRAYYNIYYAHMQALASSPEVKGYLNGKKAAALESLAQHRVRPTPAPESSPTR